MMSQAIIEDATEEVTKKEQPNEPLPLVKAKSEQYSAVNGDSTFLKLALQNAA